VSSIVKADTPAVSNSGMVRITLLRVWKSMICVDDKRCLSCPENTVRVVREFRQGIVMWSAMPRTAMDATDPAKTLTLNPKPSAMHAEG
jgi:hypothetical protein